jgi:hypothetical protein
MDREAILREDAEAYLLQESSRRRFLYRDVEELIECGFLQHTLMIEGRAVTFRSLLPQDVVRLQARMESSRTKAEVLSWSLASAIWMIDGFEISMDPRDNAVYYIHRAIFEDMPYPVLENLAVITTGFQNRITRALKVAEAFCYEPYGRSLWRLLGRPTGGLDNAPIVRRIWAAHNLAEDLTKDDDREWSHTQAIVASMSNKAAKHIRQAMQKHDDAEEARRHRVIEDAVNWIINGDEPEEPVTIMVNGQAVIVPRIHSAQTVADLEEEMRKVFTGEKDFHDTLVEQYHEQIRQRTEARRTARRSAIQEAQRKAAEREIDMGPQPIVGYTREQLAALNPDALKSRTTATVAEGAKEQHLYERYFAPRLRPGVLTPSLKVEDVQAKDVPSAARPAPREGPSTLQEQIANRKPQLKGGGG